VGNARIVDHASVDAASPVWPKRNVLLLSGAMAGVLLGLLLAGLRRPRGRGVEDPDTLEDGFGLPVLATVEKSRLQRKVRRGRRPPRVASVLAERHPDDAAVESIRSLRTVLQAASGPRSNVVLISGLQPRVGKSFVSTNLAAVIGAGGQRVLLIDGDLRRGDLHQHLARPRGLGLAAVASGSVDVREAVLPTELPNVFLLPTGPLPRNPSELLLGRPFAAALEWASREFDVVLLDAPPALAVTDATVMGKHAGVTLLVLEWGVHPPREIRRGLSRFGQANVRVAGFVLNAIPPRAAADDRADTNAAP
jgi:tyrosine-protein kinase Etk/Wzc